MFLLWCCCCNNNKSSSRVLCGASPTALALPTAIIGSSKLSLQQPTAAENTTTTTAADVKQTSSAMRATIAGKSISTTKSHIDRFVDKIFDSTDVNHDGTISFQEAYEGVLKFYITLNRQAPIPPPTREKVLLLYQQADMTRNNKLDREEYGRLLRTTVRRAFARLAAHKTLTIVGAPLLAELIVQKLASQANWLERVTSHIIPARFQDKVIPVITSKAFHRALWITILVATLGNFCLNVVNFFLDLSIREPPPIRS
jgi:hypothetical protein